jgi:hypothetical protein
MSFAQLFGGHIKAQKKGTITALDCAGATNNGTLTIAQAASGVNSVISYTGGNGGVHYGQVVNSTGVTGLTATLAAGTFANGAGSLTYSITGTPSVTGTATFAINIGGQACTLTRTVVAPPPVICNPSKPTAIIDVTNGFTGKTWMDRNLGATRVATSLTDSLAYGSLYQWGRGSDGHQCVHRYAGDGVTTSGTTTTLSNSNTPPHGDFIVTGSAFNWRNPANNSLWQGVNGINNPCPTGYRVPTRPELQNEIASWYQPPINSSLNQNGAFASPLKFSLNGARLSASGVVFQVGSGGTGRYWTSTSSPNLNSMTFTNLAASVSGGQIAANGFGVRCIKD